MGAALRPLQVAVAALAIASAGLGIARVWPELGNQHDDYSAWSSYDIAHAAALHEHLDPVLFDRLRGLVPPGARYHLDIAGTRAPAFVIRTYAAYWLLPSTPVGSAAAADVAVRIRGDSVEVARP
jgi:hypothetical protein